MNNYNSKTVGSPPALQSAYSRSQVSAFKMTSFMFFLKNIHTPLSKSVFRYLVWFPKISRRAAALMPLQISHNYALLKAVKHHQKHIYNRFTKGTLHILTSQNKWVHVSN